MKESLEVTRELALALANDRDPKGFEVGSLSRLQDKLDSPERFKFILENRLTDFESYYFELMEERGLIRFKDNRSRVHLTASGQDFCKAVADEGVWEHIQKDYSTGPFDLGGIMASSKSWREIIAAASNF